MARDPFANYDAWKLATPYDDEPATVTKGECDHDGTELGTEEELEIVETKQLTKLVKGKEVKFTRHYAHCPECAEYYSHDSSLEDLAFSVGDDAVVVDENGKYKGTMVKWVEEEPYDPRDDEDMGRYDRDDYDYV